MQATVASLSSDITSKCVAFESGLPSADEIRNIAAAGDL
jgi:hypothetical protein